MGRRSGFTLMETLLVVIILGVVATFAFPVVERGVARSTADRAAFTMSSDLRNAFSLASRQRKPVRIAFNTTNFTVTVTDKASNTVLLSRNLSHQHSAFGVTSMSTDHPWIDVFPSGIASSNVNVLLSIGENQRWIRMSRVGQVRMQ